MLDNQTHARPPGPGKGRTLLRHGKDIRADQEPRPRQKPVGLIPHKLATGNAYLCIKMTTPADNAPLRYGAWQT